MQVLNIHSRTINTSKAKLSEMLASLSTSQDQIWPYENWPPMRFKDGIKKGVQGGHGPIKYKVIHYDLNELVEFQFQKPIEFDGIHKLEIREIDKNRTEIKHTIDMNTGIIGILKWGIGVKWLHNALIEDAFDKLENQFSEKKKKTTWNLWVKLLRKLLK